MDLKPQKNERFKKCIMRSSDNFANGISALSAPTHEALSAALYDDSLIRCDIAIKRRSVITKTQAQSRNLSLLLKLFVDSKKTKPGTFEFSEGLPTSVCFF